ncbi:helix-turn-helix domain-containing protein [Rhizobium leguminosarum]|uniref:helix-turn-helix domain-containing protein n=1 Tax=Rhizobium leguminosarum TaxID=384 RepID=UPI0039DFC7A9
MRSDKAGERARAKQRNSMQAEVPAAHPVDRHIGQQIRIRRIQSDLSQSDLAKGIGVSFQQVQKYERGKNRVSASMLYELARCLKVPVAIFFEGLPEPGTGDLSQIAAKVDERVAYISTTEGRELIGYILQLPPRVRSRLLSLVSVLIEE